MKRTATRITINNDDHHSWTCHEQITCEVTGEMNSGAKVWTDIESGEQYFLSRLFGKYYFCHI